MSLPSTKHNEPTSTTVHALHKEIRFFYRCMPKGGFAETPEWLERESFKNEPSLFCDRSFLNLLVSILNVRSVCRSVRLTRSFSSQQPYRRSAVLVRPAQTGSDHERKATSGPLLHWPPNSSNSKVPDSGRPKSSCKPINHLSVTSNRSR